MKDYSDELINCWNKTLNVIAEMASVPVALVMKVTDEEISVFCKNDSINNPYKIGESEILSGSGLYCEHVIKHDELLKVPNALVDPDWDKNPDLKLGLIAYLGLPIRNAQGETFGTLCILDNKEHYFSAKVEQLLLAIKQSFEAQLSQLWHQHAEDEKNAYFDLLQLSAGVAHELNTPLGVAITATSVINSKVDTLFELSGNKQLSQKNFQELLLTLKDSNQLVERNLQLASEKVEHLQELTINQLVEEELKYNLVEILENILDLHEKKIKEAGVQLSLITKDYQHEKVRLCPNLMYQLLTNLINNALMHAFDDVKVPIIEIVVISKGSVIELHFKDNGKGVAEEECSKVFTPFYTTRKNKGSIGTGLTIVKRIVTQQLNGSIHIIPSNLGFHALIKFSI